MSEFTFKVKINASSDGEAQRKLKAGATLISKLNLKEIEKLADIVENDPVKTNLAKRALGM